MEMMDTLRVEISMTDGEIVFLAMVVAGMSIFAVTLAIVSYLAGPEPLIQLKDKPSGSTKH
jgi:hypothetical protein